MKLFFRSLIPLLLLTGILIINLYEIKMPKGPDYLAPLTQGIGFNRKGQYDRAIFFFNKAIKLNPRIDATYYGRGLAYHNKGQYDKAISDWTMAIEINPKYAEAYSNRGSAYYCKGNYDKAYSDWKRACELRPWCQFEVQESRGYLRCK